MAGQVGSPELLLGVWLLAGIITLFGALTNAEIASFIPETGGQYVYFDRMFGPFFAYLYGWAVFAVIQTGSIAAVAYVFAEYATQFVRLPELNDSLASFVIHIWGIGDVTPFKEIGTKGLAAALVVALTVVNYLGVRFGGVVQNVFTVAKVTAMALLFLGAFLLPTGGSIANMTTSSAIDSSHRPGIVRGHGDGDAGRILGLRRLEQNYLHRRRGEQPRRNIPLGLGVGMILVMVIYMLINLAYAYVLPIDVMAHSKLVAADVAEKCFAGGGRWIAAAVMISTFGTANATILASARVYFSMSRQNVFPKFLGTAHPRFHTPAASLVVQGIWSVLLLFSGTFDTLTTC